MDEELGNLRRQAKADPVDRDLQQRLYATELRAGVRQELQPHMLELRATYNIGSACLETASRHSWPVREFHVKVLLYVHYSQLTCENPPSTVPKLRRTLHLRCSDPDLSFPEDSPYYPVYIKEEYSGGQRVQGVQGDSRIKVNLAEWDEDVLELMRNLPPEVRDVIGL